MSGVIKISGFVGGIETRIGDEHREILCDCGGVVLIREHIMKSEEYKQGDRVVVSISPCNEDEFYYPKKPKKK